MFTSLRRIPAISAFTLFCSSTSPASSLASSWLTSVFLKRQPCFPIRSEDVEILHEPRQFYEKLKELASNSRTRITISSLYLGTAELEKELVEELEKCTKRSPQLEMNILLDYTRGNRVSPHLKPSSSKEILQPLVGDKCHVSFYLSPEFSKSILTRSLVSSQKWNEIISLQHMKCFLFDDTLVISGANLSDQYFMNRNDRYYCFYNCKPLCDYFDDLINTVSSFSLQLSSNGEYIAAENWSNSPLNAVTKDKFISEARERLLKFQDRYSNWSIDKIDTKKTFTFVSPVLQMKTFGIEDDQQFTSRLLENAPQTSDVKLTSGYFNLTQHYIDILLGRKFSECDVLMASESVNSFYGAKGLIGYIPSVYTHLAKTFFKELQSRDSKIRLWSFVRPNWTFHAKGLWIKTPENLMLTTIGSPNFGYRSVYRDLEAQVAVVTSDKSLQARLSEECDALWKYGNEIKDVRDLPLVPRWVQVIAHSIKTFF